MESQFTNKRIIFHPCELGIGSFGTVWLGFYEGQQVAIKKIPLSFVKEGGENALSQLIHPNIVRLFYVESDNIFRNFALELCAGTLRDYVDKRYQAVVPNHCDGLLQMARGLYHIHLQNYVHRELKPDNILISMPSTSSNVTFKISDFGLCHSVAKLNENLETLAYQAPEFLALLATDLLGDWGSCAGDIFSLGCVFYYFLTNGSHPYGNKKLFTITNIITEQSNLDDLDDKHTAKSLIQNMIQTDPGMRPNLSLIINQLEPANQGKKKCAVEIITRSSYGESDKKGRILRCCFHPQKPILACALSHGEIAVFMGTKYSNSIKDWERKVFRVPVELKDSFALCESSVTAIDWNSSGTMLASGFSCGMVVVWSETGNVTSTVRGHKDVVTSIRWNPYERKKFISGSRDRDVILWHHSNGVVRRFQPHSECICDLVWIGQDKFASCSDDNTVRVFSANSNQDFHLIRFKRPVYCLRWNSDRKQLASCSLDGSIKIWSRKTKGKTLEVSKSEPIQCMDWFCMKGSGGYNSLLACGTKASEVVVWNTEEDNAKPKYLQGHSNAVMSIAFSPNGKFLASVDEKGYLLIWNTTDWKLYYECHLPNSSFLRCLAWESNSQRLAAACTSPDVSVLEFDLSEEAR